MRSRFISRRLARGGRVKPIIEGKAVLFFPLTVGRVKPIHRLGKPFISPPDGCMGRVKLRVLLMREAVFLAVAGVG